MSNFFILAYANDPSVTRNSDTIVSMIQDRLHTLVKYWILRGFLNNLGFHHIGYVIYFYFITYTTYKESAYTSWLKKNRSWAVNENNRFKLL